MDDWQSYRSNMSLKTYTRYQVLREQLSHLPPDKLLNYHMEKLEEARQEKINSTFYRILVAIFAFGLGVVSCAIYILIRLLPIILNARG